MKMRSLLMGLLVAASAQGVATAARADTVMLVDIMLPTKAGVAPPNTIAEIKVDGSLQKGPYDSVQSKSLEYIIGARGERHEKMVSDPFFELTVDGAGSDDYSADRGLSEDWKYFSVSRDYIDPRAAGIEGRRVSPIDLCNDRLKAADGSARATFLKKGVTFLYKNAYDITGSASVKMDIGTFGKDVAESETIRVPVKITCLPLDRPKPRENADTKGPPPREGREMAPTIKKATLRVEPAHVVQDGKFLCPSQLKLHGYMETIREFHGKALFVGPHYLSAITTLNFQAKGSRNVTGTYKMNWHQMGGLATAPNAEPKKQKLTFYFNVSDKDGKLLKSVEETVEVSCKKIKVNAPTAGNGMTVNPAN
jgi:hypothetical protein